MLAFVVSVNGERLCSVGLTSENMRWVDVSWVGRAEEELFFLIRGMDDSEHLDWSVPQLRIGDEVTIKIVESAITNPPSTRKTLEKRDRSARRLEGEDTLPPLPAPWD